MDYCSNCHSELNLIYGVKLDCADVLEIIKKHDPYNHQNSEDVFENISDDSPSDEIITRIVEEYEDEICDDYFPNKYNKFTDDNVKLYMSYPGQFECDEWDDGVFILGYGRVLLSNMADEGTIDIIELKKIANTDYSQINKVIAKYTDNKPQFMKIRNRCSYCT
jgi:hypothetical protein